MEWLAVWHTGPDAGGSVRLPSGRHVVGRASSAGVRCDDPALAPHHLLVDLGVHDVRVVHLAAVAPRTATPDAGGRGPTDDASTVDAHIDLHVGDSVLRLLRPGHDAAGATAVGQSRNVRPPPGTPAHDIVLRGPRAIPRWDAPALPAIPDDGPSSSADEHHGGTLLPTLLGVAGAAVIAVVVRQPMFLLFGTMGALVAVASWVLQRRSDTRRRGRARRALETAVRAREAAVLAAARDFRHHVERSLPTARSARDAVAAERLWGRRRHHGDAFLVSVGRGAVSWHPDVATEPDLPVVADLGPGARLAVVGTHAAAVARSLIAQLATECGPADLRIVLVTDHPDRWSTVASLPHLRGADGGPNVVTARNVPDALAELGTTEAGNAGDGTPAVAPHVLLVCDDAAALTTRTGPLRRALAGSAASAALLAVLEHGPAPAPCTAVVSTEPGPFAAWLPDTAATSAAAVVRITGLGAAATAAIVTALAPRRDPEDALDAARLPADVDLVLLLRDDGTQARGANVAPPGDGADVAAPSHELSAADVRARWVRHGDEPPRTPIGIADDGVVDLDLGRDGPHGLLAGTTGSGKSELLRSLVVGLAASTHPRHLQLVLVDYKGGATFDDLARLPHVAAVVTDLDEALADRALRSLHAELRRREAVLRDVGAADLRALVGMGGHLPRLAVVIDEFAALVAEQPSFLHALLGIAQRGRSLGVHLLLATQRPHGVISDDIRANTDLRIALRLHDAADALDVVGDRRAAGLPRRVPGRAVMRLGPDEHVVFQAARLAAPNGAITAIIHAADGWDPPPPPWLPPLPSVLDPSDVPDGTVGWCDDPDRQRRVPLTWAPDEGGLLVAGARGSGVTSTLRTLAAHAARSGHAVHVLHTAQDTPWLDLDQHPGVVLVPNDDGERVARLLRRLHDPAWSTPDGRRSVVVVDDIDVLRRALDEPATAAEHDMLDAVLASPRHAPLVGTSHPASVPSAVVARCAQRWVLHLPDGHDAAVLGVRTAPAGASSALAHAPLPGRITVSPTGLAAQLVAPHEIAVDRHLTRWLPRIDTVPSMVCAARLPAAMRTDQSVRLPVGIDVSDAAPLALEVPDGEHVLVVGGPRSGRSTALGRLLAAWRVAHPDGTAVAVLPRRSTVDARRVEAVARTPDELASLLAERAAVPLLIVCDDAELVDDGGPLARLTSARHPGTTVIAAVRGDAVRQRFGHWTTAVRHSHLGLVAAGSADRDGDLLGVALPVRSPVRARPGLMWAVDHSGHRLVQVAVDEGGGHRDAAAHAANAAVAAIATSSSDRCA